MTITLTPTPQNYGVPTAAAVLAGLYCKKAMTILSRETNQKVLKPLNKQLFRSNVHVTFNYDLLYFEGCTCYTRKKTFGAPRLLATAIHRSKDRRCVTLNMPVPRRSLGSQTEIGTGKNRIQLVLGTNQPIWFQPGTLYTRQFLQQTAFPGTLYNFYTRHLLHQTPLRPNTFYTRQLWQQTTFTPSTLDTRHPLNQKPFTPDTFNTRHLLQKNNLYTRHPSRQKPFAPNNFYTRHLLH